ncbi:hypothetical protein AKO1_011407 [Acrasis kona]|uniref:t-SNARE coiled-coil homology domain-containing protein n=1 Tax=Acrasis kona TaxID=1008807 RepID=A0AAW2ZIH1_9EUKA
MSFADLVKNKDNVKTHVIDIGLDDPSIVVKKKAKTTSPQQFVNKTKQNHVNVGAKADIIEIDNQDQEAQELAENIAEQIRLSYGNMNQIDKMLAKLGGTQDTHEHRQNLYATLVEKYLPLFRNKLMDENNENLKEIMDSMKRFENLARNDDVLKSQLTKLKNDVVQFASRIKKQTTEVYKKEKMYVVKAKQEVATKQSYYESSSEITKEPTEEHSLLMDSKRQQLNTVKNEIEFNELIIKEREEDFAKIEEQIVDINSIFRELNYMVSEQGEHLDLIEAQVEDAAIKVHTGGENLQTANETDKKGRNVMCIILVLLLGITAVVAVLLIILKSLNIF